MFRMFRKLSSKILRILKKVMFFKSKKSYK